MKFFKNIKLAYRMGLCLLVVTFIGMTFLRVFITNNVSSSVDKNISNQMLDAVTSRASLIEDYVSDTEKKILEFSLSSEVKNLLKKPDDKKTVAKAQSYTENFAAVDDIFE